MLTLSEWRPMTPADIHAVDEIGRVVHPGFPEDIAVLKNRLALFPAGCFVADGEDARLGYAVSHPSVVGRPAPLNTVIDALPRDADCLFLHDIALTEGARGHGLGGSLLEKLKTVARHAGFARLGLVSVNNSRAYWLAQGFRVLEADETLAAKLATYEADAAYMLFDIA
ncbi:MAG: GNAT family N-acetyltransferase [Parvibaculum sp.]|uniref:GNAT family N-acetyltransferase n=1 Tax=Parvibaculum sp. TaxID=2024848 RepID=UPI0025F5B445|nr:GNAT family N-acetyltransferase [Parvibaculum sp.]MCE9649503.1 GNAT family N-acetyltransferase [Parvibaculum sp.]